MKKSILTFFLLYCSPNWMRKKIYMKDVGKMYVNQILWGAEMKDKRATHLYNARNITNFNNSMSIFYYIFLSSSFNFVFHRWPTWNCKNYILKEKIKSVMNFFPSLDVVFIKIMISIWSYMCSLFKKDTTRATTSRTRCLNKYVIK